MNNQAAEMQDVEMQDADTAEMQAADTAEAAVPESVALCVLETTTFLSVVFRIVSLALSTSSMYSFLNCSSVFSGAVCGFIPKGSLIIRFCCFGMYVCWAVL